MRIVLDTNVFVSGVFFTGPPYHILKAWREGKVNLLVSLEILEEYQRVGAELNAEFPDIDLSPVLELLAVKAEVWAAPTFSAPICRDPDDDKFLACAVESRATAIVSGDKDLLILSPFQNIPILTPRAFARDFL